MQKYKIGEGGLDALPGWSMWNEPPNDISTTTVPIEHGSWDTPIGASYSPKHAIRVNMATTMFRDASRRRVARQFIESNAARVAP